MEGALMDYTATEMMTVAASRALRPTDVAAVLGEFEDSLIASLSNKTAVVLRTELAPGMPAIDAEPAELAARELREETGLRATSFEMLGQLDVAPGMTSQRGWVFLATGIVEGQADREHEEQDMLSAWFSRDEVETMMRSGVIVDAQSVAAYGLFLLRHANG